MTIELRPAISEDALDVATVLIASRDAFLPYAPMAHTVPEIRAWVRDVLLPSGHVTVACEGAQVVGVLATARQDDAAWIEQLYLLPGWTGQGIGARLLAHALATLPRPIRLYTFQANEGARAFYERHGFEALAYSDGAGNEERCPDVLYELPGAQRPDQAVDQPHQPIPVSQLLDEWFRGAAWLRQPQPRVEDGNELDGWGEFDWTIDHHPEHAWEAIVAATHDERLPMFMATFAAGPLEDLLSQQGARFIDRVEAEAAINPIFASLLGGVWQFQMSDEVWARVRAAWDRRGWDGIPLD